MFNPLDYRSPEQYAAAMEAEAQRIYEIVTAEAALIKNHAGCRLTGPNDHVLADGTRMVCELIARVLARGFVVRR